MDNVNDTTTPTDPTGTGDSTESLEELRNKLSSLEQEKETWNKEMTKARQEVSEYKKQIDAQAPAQPPTNPYQPYQNPTQNIDPITDAKIKLGLPLDKPIADQSYVNSTVNKTIEDKFSEYQKRVDVNSFADKHNGTVKMEEAKLSPEDRERLFTLVNVGNLDLKSALFAIKGEALLKEMQTSDQNFKGRTVTTGRNQIDQAPVIHGTDIKPRELGDPVKYNEAFDKWWDDVTMQTE